MYVDPVSAYSDSRPTRRGSFGLVVRDLARQEHDEDDRLILTAAHLLDGVPDGTRMLSAPPGLEPASADGRFCGNVRRRVPLQHLPEITVDAAVIKPKTRVECRNDLKCGAPKGIRDLRVVEDQSEVLVVKKQGAQTGLTEGEMMPAAAVHYMADVRSRYSGGWWVYGTDGPFASRGDSGSIVVDDERRVVGMVVGMESDVANPGAYIHPIRLILDALEVALP